MSSDNDSPTSRTQNTTTAGNAARRQSMKHKAGVSLPSGSADEPTSKNKKIRRASTMLANEEAQPVQNQKSGSGAEQQAKILKIKSRKSKVASRISQEGFHK